MSEEKDSSKKVLPFNETVMTLILENNALLSVLVRAVGELLAEKRGRDIEDQIEKLFKDVREDRKRLIDVLSQDPE